MKLPMTRFPAAPCAADPDPGPGVEADGVGGTPDVPPIRPLAPRAGDQDTLAVARPVTRPRRVRADPIVGDRVALRLYPDGGASEGDDIQPLDGAPRGVGPEDQPIRRLPAAVELHPTLAGPVDRHRDGDVQHVGRIEADDLRARDGERDMGRAVGTRVRIDVGIPDRLVERAEAAGVRVNHGIARKQEPLLAELDRQLGRPLPVSNPQLWRSLVEPTRGRVSLEERGRVPAVGRPATSRRHPVSWSFR